MASPRSAGENGAEDGADAVGDAFQLVAQELAQLQEALRLQKQEAESKVQEALQLHKQETERKIQEAEWRMREALRLQEERTSAALRDIERKLEEDATLRDFLQRRQEAQESSTASEGSPTDSLQNLESRAGQSDSDGSLKSAVEMFLPTLFESLLRTLEQQSPHPSLSTAPATGRAEAGGGEKPPSSSSAPTPSGAGHQGAAADEEERERQTIERRVREVLLNLERARASPSPLGEQLCEAAYEGSTSDVIRLLDSGADVNYTNSIGYTPLLNVVLRSADPFVLGVLVQRGADVNAITSVGNSALHWAAMSDFDGSCVERLVREGADVDARNVHGETPLLIAARSNNVEAVCTLLTARARKYLRPWGGFQKNKTPFDLATCPLVRSLLRG